MGFSCWYTSQIQVCVKLSSTELGGGGVRVRRYLVHLELQIKGIVPASKICSTFIVEFKAKNSRTSLVCTIPLFRLMFISVHGLSHPHHLFWVLSRSVLASSHSSSDELGQPSNFFPLSWANFLMLEYPPPTASHLQEKTCEPFIIDRLLSSF